MGSEPKEAPDFAAADKSARWYDAPNAAPHGEIVNLARAYLALRVVPASGPAVTVEEWSNGRWIPAHRYTATEGEVRIKDTTNPQQDRYRIAFASRPAVPASGERETSFAPSKEWSYQMAVREMQTEANDLRWTVTRLVSALENFGRHHPHCALLATTEAACDCGLADHIALRAHPPASPAAAPRNDLCPDCLTVGGHKHDCAGYAETFAAIDRERVERVRAWAEATPLHWIILGHKGTSLRVSDLRILTAALAASRQERGA